MADDALPNDTASNVAVTRTFDVPVDQVWKAWVDPEYVMQWWGPDGFTSPLARIDFREGGTSLVSMRSPEGQDLYNTWTYGRIVAHQRIEFVLRFTDQAGKPLDPHALGMPPGIPEAVPHVVTFAAVDGSTTEMTVTEYGYASEQVAEVSRMGLEQSLDKMTALFAGQRRDS